MAIRLLQYGPDASINDVALLYANGTKFTDEEFAAALNYKGLHDSASARSSAMRGYGLLAAYKGVRELTDLAIEVLHPASLEPLIHASSRPACHQKAWSDTLRTGERQFKPIPNHTAFSHALYTASLKCGFLKEKDVWDHEAISQAQKAKFDRSWSRDISHVGFPSVIIEKPRCLSLENEIQGLRVEFFPDNWGVFPEPMLEQDLWFAKQSLPGYSCKSDRWVLVATKPLDVSSCKQAYRSFLAMRESLENG